MDMRVRKPVSHPMPEIAAFVADMKSALASMKSMKPFVADEPGSRRSLRAKMAARWVPLVRWKRMSGLLTVPCATATTVTAATGRASEGRYPAATD